MKAKTQNTSLGPELQLPRPGLAQPNPCRLKLLTGLRLSQSHRAAQQQKEGAGCVKDSRAKLERRPKRNSKQGEVTAASWPGGSRGQLA